MADETSDPMRKIELQNADGSAVYIATEIPGDSPSRPPIILWKGKVFLAQTELFVDFQPYVEKTFLRLTDDGKAV